MTGNAYHEHLDVCRRCREHPFALCPDGARLLREAALEPEPQPAQTTHRRAPRTGRANDAGRSPIGPASAAGSSGPGFGLRDLERDDGTGGEPGAVAREARPTSRDPQTREEWQEAVDLAHFYLVVHAAVLFGLVESTAAVDVDRCAYILGGGAARGVRPSHNGLVQILTEIDRPLETVRKRIGGIVGRLRARRRGAR